MEYRCSTCGQGSFEPTPSGKCQICLSQKWLHQHKSEKIELNDAKVEKLGIKELLDN